MKKQALKLSSVNYIGVTSLCIIYAYYFVKKLYFMPYLQYYNLLLAIYRFIAIPAIYFSVAAFVTIIAYTLIPKTISNLFQKYFLALSVLFLLVYVILVLLMLLNLSTLSIITIVSEFPLSFVILGVLFSLGLYKKENI